MAINYADIVHEWYEKLQPHFVNTIVGKFSAISRADAMDLYQQAFIAVYDNIQRDAVRPDTKVDSYIMQIGMNLANKSLRHKGITDSYSTGGDDEDDAPKNLLSRVEALLAKEAESENTIYTDPKAQSILGEELEYVPEPCRSILRFFYIDQMSMREIALAMDYKNEVTVRNRRHQCFGKLVDRVKKALRLNGLID